jgi:hypothetical protein
MKETILCAACFFPNFPQDRYSKTLYISLPKNISSGLVIQGRRHSDCLAMYINFCSAHADPIDAMNNVDGFITSSNKFLTREQAWVVAKEAGQLFDWALGLDEGSLISEHLYQD